MQRITAPAMSRYAMLDSAVAPPVESVLACSAAQYVVAQRERLRAGEQLRAALQGRDASWGSLHCDPAEVNLVLRAIASGTVPPCLRLLGRWYAQWSAEERRLRAEMAEAMRAHVVWPWLRHVRGIGPSLGAQLLARLDVRRAPHPASFWAYCGLGTVAVGDNGRLRRVAEPRTPRGHSSRYDHAAKRLCYLAGVSFVRKGAWYRLMYDLERARLERTHGDWTPSHRHRAAARSATKIFLRDLWCVWSDLAAGSGTPHARRESVEHAWKVARFDADDPSVANHLYFAGPAGDARRRHPSPTSPR